MASKISHRKFNRVFNELKNVPCKKNKKEKFSLIAKLFNCTEAEKIPSMCSFADLLDVVSKDNVSAFAGGLSTESEYSDTVAYLSARFKRVEGVKGRRRVL